MPLSSYIIKPMQRITKYPLLVNRVSSTFTYYLMVIGPNYSWAIQLHSTSMAWFLSLYVIQSLGRLVTLLCGIFYSCKTKSKFLIKENYLQSKKFIALNELSVSVKNEWRYLRALPILCIIDNAFSEYTFLWFFIVSSGIMVHCFYVLNEFCLFFLKDLLIFFFSI